MRYDRVKSDPISALILMVSRKKDNPLIDTELE